MSWNIDIDLDLILTDLPDTDLIGNVGELGHEPTEIDMDLVLTAG